MSVFAGIDIGGTAVKFGLTDSTGQVLRHDQRRTPVGREPLLTALVEIVEGYRADHQIAGVGVGTAGAVDFETGTVVGHSPHLPGWAGTEVKAILSARLKLPVTVDNDANCMALAESRLGAGAGCTAVFFLTLGTGVGSAFVQNGRLWRGAHSLGGEFGHATVVKDGRPCACGQRGHLEAYASASALVLRTLELARQGLPSLYGQVSDVAASALGSREIFAAASGGDAAAAQAISETASYLATGIASAVNLLDPDRVVVGGGMVQSGGHFLTTVENEVRGRVHAGLVDLIEVVPALLGNEAGWVGAALLAASPA
jgi:glucokinase